MFTLPEPLVASKKIREKYLKQLRELQSESDDPDTQISAIILSKCLKKKVSRANGLIDGVNKTTERLTRPEKYQWIECAERRAIQAAARYGLPLNGSAMFTLCTPCMACARSIAGSGIKRVYVDYDFTTSYLKSGGERWGKSFEQGLMFLREAGVQVTFLTSQND